MVDQENSFLSELYDLEDKYTPFAIASENILSNQKTKNNSTSVQTKDDAIKEYKPQPTHNKKV